MDENDYENHMPAKKLKLKMKRVESKSLSHKSIWFHHCDFEALDEDDLNKHKSDAHVNNVPTKQSIPSITEFICYECGHNACSKNTITDHIKNDYASPQALQLIHNFGDHFQTEKHFTMSSENKIFQDHIPFYSGHVGIVIKQEMIKEDKRRETL